MKAQPPRQRQKSLVLKFKSTAGITLTHIKAGITLNHRRKKTFLHFLFRPRFYVFYLFCIFLKTLSKAMYEYAKIQQETLLQDASAMIFIDFGLLRSPYCKISYLLKCADVTQIWWCHLRKHLQILAKFSIKRLQTFFFYFATFFTFLTFFILIWTFIT